MTSGEFWSGVGEFFRRSMWPRGFSGRLGRILGALSILRLIELGFTSGFGSVLGLLLEYYERLLGWLVWPIEPFIKAWIAQLHRYIGWPEALYTHWKHVFVLLGIYFFREVGIKRPYDAGTVFNLFLGLSVALTCGVLAGTIPLTKADEASNFLIGAALILGAVAYAVIGFVWDATFVRHQYAKDRNRLTPTWWGHFSWGLKRIFLRSLVGLVLLWVGLQIPIVQEMPSPGLAMSIVLVIAFALYWLWDGVKDGNQIRREDESRRAAYWRSLHTQLGLAILGPIFWCFVFIVMRAGNVV